MCCLFQFGYFFHFISLLVWCYLIFDIWFRFKVDPGHVLSYTILAPEILIWKFTGQPVTFQCLIILFKKFLLNTEVMISDCQNSNSVFEVSLHLEFLKHLFIFSHIFLLLVAIRQKVKQQCGLNSHNSLMRMKHSQIMPLQLWQHRTSIQMSVCFGSCPRRRTLQFKSFL